MSVDLDDFTHSALQQAGVEEVQYVADVLPLAMFLVPCIGGVPLLWERACVCINS